MNGPAPRSVDEALFKAVPPALARLQGTARKELRQQARAEYWSELQAALANEDAQAQAAQQQQQQAESPGLATSIESSALEGGVMP